MARVGFSSLPIFLFFHPRVPSPLCLPFTYLSSQPKVPSLLSPFHISIFPFLPIFTYPTPNPFPYPFMSLFSSPPASRPPSPVSHLETFIPILLLLFFPPPSPTFPATLLPSRHRHNVRGEGEGEGRGGEGRGRSPHNTAL